VILARSRFGATQHGSARRFRWRPYRVDIDPERFRIAVGIAACTAPDIPVSRLCVPLLEFDRLTLAALLDSPVLHPHNEVACVPDARASGHEQGDCCKQG